jgi:hypothetical protein
MDRLYRKIQEIDRGHTEIVELLRKHGAKE